MYTFVAVIMITRQQAHGVDSSQYISETVTLYFAIVMYNGQKIDFYLFSVIGYY